MSNLLTTLIELRSTLAVDAEVMEKLDPTSPAYLTHKKLEGLIEEERNRISSPLYVGQRCKTANGRTATIIAVDAKIDRGNSDVVALVDEPDGSHFIEWYESKDAPSGMLRGSGENLDLILE